MCIIIIVITINNIVTITIIIIWIWACKKRYNQGHALLQSVAYLDFDTGISTFDDDIVLKRYFR